jgi:hypothetical protein
MDGAMKSTLNFGWNRLALDAKLGLDLQNIVSPSGTHVKRPAPADCGNVHALPALFDEIRR